MKRRVLCALCVAGVLAAPAAGSPDTPPPAPAPDIAAPTQAPPASEAPPVPEAAPAPEPTETNGAVEEAAEPPSQPTVAEAPADVPPAEADAADPDRPRSASKRRQSTRPVARAAAGSVVIRDFEFSPAKITIAVGETVTWTNEGPTEHSATSDAFDTGLLAKGERGSHTFETAGTFAYLCTPHPFMKATVLVEAADEDSPPATQDDDPQASSDADADENEEDDAADAEADDEAETLPDTGLNLLPAGAGILLLAAGLALRSRK